MDIGAVIVTYKRYGELKKTIKAILSEGFVESDILVIDNNSPEIFSKDFYLQFPEIALFHFPSNISSSGGFAMGMEFWHKKEKAFVWLFNDDSRPISGAMHSIKYSLVKLAPDQLGLIKIGNLNSEGKAVILNWEGVRKPSYIPISDYPRKTDLVTFDGCLISSNLMDKIGYCDPKYFMGTYEFDFCLRAKDAGFDIYTLPNGLIEDGKLGSVGGTPPWRQYYNTRNHLWLGLKRRDWTTIQAWIIREAKFTYAILRWEDQKTLRLRFKLLAFVHAIIGKRGKVLDPVRFSK